MKPTRYFLLATLWLAALLAALPAWAQWPTSPDERLVVASATSEKMVSDGAGGAFILLSNGAMAGLQKLDLYGYPVFPEPITLEYNFGDYIGQIHLVTDGIGGAIAAVRYTDSVSDSARVRLFRFDHEGNNVYWSVSPGEPENWWASYEYTIAPDSAGGVYILYPITPDDQRIQHLGPNGERLWGDTGIFLDVGAPSEWDWPALGTDAEYCYASVKGIERHAFKFTFAGDPLWGSTGVVLPPFGYYVMKISPDGTGGMVGIDKGYVGGQHHLTAFRLNAGGQWVWPQGGIDLGEMDFQLNLTVRCPYTFVCWDSARNENSRSRLCKLDSAGALVWPTNINIFSNQIMQMGIRMSDADNEGLIFFGYQGAPGSPFPLYAQKYSYEGDRLWDVDVEVATPPSGSDLCLYGDGSGGGLYAWHEIDPLWGHRICAAMVNRDGQMGVVLGVENGSQVIVPEITDILIFPNPSNSQFSLQLPTSIPPLAPLELRLTDLLGRTVYQSRITAERRIIPLFNALGSLPSLSSGIYLLEVKSNGNSWQQKIVHVR